MKYYLLLFLLITFPAQAIEPTKQTVLTKQDSSVLTAKNGEVIYKGKIQYSNSPVIIGELKFSGLTADGNAVLFLFTETEAPKQDRSSKVLYSNVVGYMTAEYKKNPVLKISDNSSIEIIEATPDHIKYKISR